MSEKIDTILYAKDIPISSLSEYENQYKKIPKNWLYRFLKDNWKLLFITDNSICNFQPDASLIVFSDIKRIYINIKNCKASEFQLYKGFLYYIESEYGDPSKSIFFEKICEKEKIMLSKLLEMDLNKSSLKDVFQMLFIYMLESSSKSSIDNSLQSCAYVKAWLNEDVFRINTSKLPNYLQIGSDVAEQQISVIVSSWKYIPKKIRMKFSSLDWHILLTNSREWRNDLNKNKFVGFLMSKKELIIVKSSYKNLKLALFHEFGHFLYLLEMNNVLIKENFYEAYLQEKDNYFEFTNDEYGISTVEEYFAQIFTYYLNNPNLIQLYSRRSFKIMETIIKIYQ